MVSAVKNVGLIGLGKMGLPMGRHMAAKGFHVVGFDLRADAIAAAKGVGVGNAASPSAVAAQCDLTIVVVGFDSDVENAMFGTNGVLAGAKRGSDGRGCPTA